MSRDWCREPETIIGLNIHFSFIVISDDFQGAPIRVLFLLIAIGKDK